MHVQQKLHARTENSMRHQHHHHLSPVPFWDWQRIGGAILLSVALIYFSLWAIFAH